eukprot:TRINITY_DN4986_c0_g1_i1.p1 TRINITY_DN4986_c0_g1~~TRINITY_DN4986_c0_g1_i1.p1  ORF type:complete len:1209 (-),score=173.40 TRINITY_DN4986_c0_g1_i1:45-3671(-)
MDPYDVAHSCGRFGILPPHQEAEPWSMPLYTVFPSPFPAVLPLSSDEILRGDSNIPKRMNFYWLRQVTSLDSSRKYSNGEPETCSITLQPKLVNNIGENFHSRVSGFVRKHPHCNHTAIEETKKEFSSIISKMQRSVHVDELVLYQLKISSLMNSDLVLGCKDLLESLLVMNETSYTFEHEQGCNGNEFSPTWDSDPCCNLDLEWEMCCAQDVVFTAPTIESVDYPATSKCHLSECAEIALENYKTTGNVNARETGCSAVWEKSIRDVVYEPQLIFDCATKLWGPFDMEGVSCTSNDDCFYGAECDLVHEKCVHDQTHFLSCISLSKVRIIGQLLANHWDMEVLATYEMFVMEVYKRFIKPMCTGPGSTAFRPHYDYLPLGNNICEDPCTEENIIISCLSTDEVSCPKDDVCPPFDFTWCARSFTFVNETRNSECLEEKYCNWMACGNLDQSECEEACLSNMEPMCLDCSSTPCTPLIGWDQSRCERGLCVEDPELDDSEFCKTQLGDCSLPCPDCNKSQCEALHMCDGIIEYMLFLELNNVTADGGCFSRPYVNGYGTSECIIGVMHQFGCLVSTFNEQTSCESEGHKWVSTQISTEECETAYQGCVNEEGALNMKDREQCECAGQNWTSYFKLADGVYTPGRIRPLVWSAPVWQSVRKVEPAMDLLSAMNDVQTVITRYASLEYAKEGMCRFNPLLEVFSIIACDCHDAEAEHFIDDDEIIENEACYRTTRDGNIVDLMWGCPFIHNTHDDKHFNLTVDINSFPGEFDCKVIIASLLPYNLFTSQAPDARLSSHVFVENPENIFTIITYQKLIVEGQIVTNGVRLEWEVEGTIGTPLELCIPVSEDIDQSQLFDFYGMGEVVSDENGVISVKPLNESLSNEVDGWICAQITEPGDYIGLLLRDPKSQYDSLLAQSIVASVLYFVLLAGVLYQVLCIIKLDLVRKNQKLLFASIAFLFLLIRAVYFIVYPIGLIEDQPIASYFVFEFPTFLFLIMNSTVIYLWLEISRTMKSLKHVSGSGVNSRLFAFWVVWNLFILLCFVGFIVAYYATPSGSEQLPCSIFFSVTASQSKLDVSLAYVIFVAVLSIFMAFTFIVIGLLFLLPIMFHEDESKHSEAQKHLMLYTWLVMSTFALCFVAKSVLLLIAATTLFTVPIIVFALLEQVPTAVLLWYIRPPHINSNSGSSRRTSSNNSSGGERKSRASGKSKI